MGGLLLSSEGPEPEIKVPVGPVPPEAQGKPVQDPSTEALAHLHVPPGFTSVLACPPLMHVHSRFMVSYLAETPPFPGQVTFGSRRAMGLWEGPGDCV